MSQVKINSASSSDIFLNLCQWTDHLTKWEEGQYRREEVIKVLRWSRGPKSQDIVEV